MGNEFKDFEMETPSLTLEPDLGEFEKKEEVIPKKQTQKEEVPVLTPEEQKMVNDFAAKIDIENTNQILQYGAGTQKKMADFSDTALENVKTQDLGEIGELISNVVGELKDFDVQEEGKFFGFFRKQTSKIENLKNKYDKAQANVEKITDSLQQHQVRLMKDSAMLDKMYEQNLNYFKELTMYILAGKKKLEETRNGKLAEMKNKAALSGLPEDAQAARDLDEKCTDGTLEWCGPYAKDKNAANGTGGWPGNNEIATNSTQINYNGSTGMRGKGNVYGSCYTAFANHFWWDDDTDRPYAWLINFSTEGITTSHISMQISVMNTQQSFFSPRFWCAEWSLTDSQAAKDDSQWNLIGEYTIPDVSVWANTLYSSCVAYKSIDFELPQEILGHENVYIRLRPTSDLCSDGSDYANARLNQSASGAALAAEHASSLEYFAIRYNK